MMYEILPERLRKQLAFIDEIDKMKSIYRQTMLLDRSRHESDAEHSWHLAISALLLQEYANDTIDIQRVLHMTLVHDLVEIYAGDTFAYDTTGYADKERREREAADKLFSILPDEQGSQFRMLWEEFERMDTPDARYAAALDRFMPFIINVHTDGYAWVKHKVTAAQIYKRMEPIKNTIPVLWGFIEERVREAQAKGYVI